MIEIFIPKQLKFGNLVNFVKLWKEYIYNNQIEIKFLNKQFQFEANLISDSFFIIPSL